MVTKDRPIGVLQRKPPSLHSIKLVLQYFTVVWTCTFLTTLFCFPHTTTDSKQGFKNSNGRKNSNVWNLMHNSVPCICKTDSFQNVWKKILMSGCSPTVKVNTHTNNMLLTLIYSFMTKATISA